MHWGVGMVGHSSRANGRIETMNSNNLATSSPYHPWVPGLAPPPEGCQVPTHKVPPPLGERHEPLLSVLAIEPTPLHTVLP